MLLAAGGIAAAAAMLGASVTVAYGLATGFDRTAARAQLPDVLATFQPEPRRDVERVVSSLANVRAASYRIQAAHVFLASGRRRYEDDATVVGVPPGGPRGYAIVGGRDRRSAREVVIEQGLAREWHLRPGSRMNVGGDDVRVVGVAVAPDNVASRSRAGRASGSATARPRRSPACPWARSTPR